MSELNIELPKLRPYARQGKAYYTELRAILKAEGEALYQDAWALRKLSPAKLCRLALFYRLNLKATTEYLEDRNVIPTGTYDRCFVDSKNLRPIASLKTVWMELTEEERAEIMAEQAYEREARNAHL